MRVSFSMYLLWLFVGILFCPSIHAQERAYGDVTMKDFFDYDQSYDSTSPAIALLDRANVYFDDRYNVIMERHTRFKILNESGLDYGDVQLVFDRDVEQNIDDIEASSYTIENGQVKRSDISRRDVYEDRLVEDVYAKKFTMPNVEKGAIIEYKYTKRLGNPFFLPDWEFHKEIPVQHSSIYMKIPARFRYHMVFKGTDTLYTTRSGTIDRSPENEYFIEISKDSLPPVEDLPFIDSRDNFISKVFTQLRYAYRDDGREIDYLKDWEQIAEEIRDHSEIGKQRTNRKIRKKVEELTMGDVTQMDKLKSIFEFVSTSMVWNGRHRVVSEKGIRDAFKEKSGSSADINILLYKMLEDADIKVYYGLTSTRANGIVLPDYPIVSQFNHIIVIAEIDGRALFLDATDGYRSLRLPPVKDIYQLAYVVQDDSFGWIEIKPMQQSISKDLLRYSIDESGRAHATLTNTTMGYLAELRRNKFDGKSEEEATKNILEDIDGLEIDTVLVRNMEVTQSNTSVHYTEFSFDAFNGDSLKAVNYLNPLLFLADNENLLERPTREFPVNFPFPVQESKNVTITIPKGYRIDEVPESATVVLPNNKGQLNFQVRASDSTLTINSDLILSKIYFNTDEYQDLREMLLKLLESHSGAVVIKKQE